MRSELVTEGRNVDGVMLEVSAARDLAETLIVAIVLGIQGL